MSVEWVERRRGELHRNAENATRLAVVRHTFDVTGSGVIEFPDAAEFELSFIERPSVGVGWVVDLDELANAYGVSEAPPVPHLSGFVTEYDQNERDFYTGAWCGVSVQWTTSPPEGEFTMIVDFTFTGIGIKDVDPKVRE